MWQLSLSQGRVLGFIYVDLSMIRQDGTQRLIETLSDHHADEILKGDWIGYILPKFPFQSQLR